MRAFRKFCAFGFGTLLCLTPLALAQAPEHELKAAFVFNFVQFTEWPNGSLPADRLTLCVSPGSPFARALQELEGKRAHNRPLVVVALGEAHPGDCQVVIATPVDRPQLATLKRLIGTGPVLAITDASELARENMLIHLQIDNGRMVFDIDNTKAQSSGLILSSRILRLARSVR